MSSVPFVPFPSQVLDFDRNGSLPDASIPALPLALHAAAAVGDRAWVRWHLTRGASPSEPGPGGWSPLHHAAIRGDERLAQLLLAAGAAPDQRCASGCAGATPLHCAIAGRASAVVGRLLAAGARTDLRDDVGYTPLHLAAELGDLGITRALLRAGARPTAEIDEWTPLDLARRGRHHAVAALLAQVAAKPCRVTSR